MSAQPEAGVAASAASCRCALSFSCLLLALVLGACGGGQDDAGGGGKRLDRAALFHLRNLARLHALRDTKQGYEKAAALLTRVVAARPWEFEDRLNLARVLVFVRGREEEARRSLQQARDLWGKKGLPPPALDFLAGLCAKRAGRMQGMLAAFKRVLKRLPDQAQARFQVGRAAEDLRDLKSAEEAYQELLRRKLLVRPAAYRLAQVYRRLEQPEKRQKVIKIFKAQPTDLVAETEKCALTLVSMRPEQRGGYEPPFVQLSFTDVTNKLLAGGDDHGWREVLPLAGETVPGTRLILAGDGGLFLLDLQGAASQKPKLIFPGAAVASLLAGDLQNDGFLDLLFFSKQGWKLLSGSKRGSFEESHPLDPALWKDVSPECVRLFDADHDGDLDVVAWSRKAGTPLLLQNNGDHGFVRLTPFDIKGKLLATGQFDAQDLDQGQDLDFVFPGTKGAVVCKNLRSRGYAIHRLPELAGRSWIMAADLDNDGGPDILGAGGVGGWTLLHNQDPRGDPQRLRFNLKPGQLAGDCGVIRQLVLGDLDNDGDLDAVGLDEQGLLLLRNTAGGHFKLERPISLPEQNWARVVLADVDGDGFLDLLLLSKKGQLKLLTTEGSPAYASLLLRLKGRRDNARGIGVGVESYGGRGFGSFMVKSSLGLHLGLGGKRFDVLDGLVLHWPLGIRQSVRAAKIKQEASGVVRIRQSSGLVTSCPFLYVHSRQGWRFLTDILGIAPLDEWLPPGETPHLDPEEYVRIPGEALQAEGGVVTLAITEELKETAYLDRVELYGVDHDPDELLFLDESSRQGAYDPLRVHIFRRAALHPVQEAWAAGREVTAQVREQDGRYLHGYPPVRSQWEGWEPPYAIDFTTGAPATWLLLTGRIAWYDSAVAYSLHQNGRGWEPLSLVKLDARGRELPLVKDLGVPAGMDRTMVVALGAHPLPAGTRLRLKGQHRFLWDRLLLARTARTVTLVGRDGHLPAPEPRLVVRRARLLGALLREHGFSKVLGDRARDEQTYAYDQAGPADIFRRPRGRATRFGDVRKLVAAHDDQLVTLLPGDGCRIRFKAPPKQAGLARTWFLRVSGWAKEDNYHIKSGHTVGPLPFRAMQSYPPSHPRPGPDPAFENYLKRYQTRWIWR